MFGMLNKRFPSYIGVEEKLVTQSQKPQICNSYNNWVNVPPPSVAAADGNTFAVELQKCYKNNHCPPEFLWHMPISAGFPAHDTSFAQPMEGHHVKSGPRPARASGASSDSRATARLYFNVLIKAQLKIDTGGQRDGHKSVGDPQGRGRVLRWWSLAGFQCAELKPSHHVYCDLLTQLYSSALKSILVLLCSQQWRFISPLIYWYLKRWLLRRTLCCLHSRSWLHRAQRASTFLAQLDVQQATTCSMSTNHAGWTIPLSLLNHLPPP